MTTTETRINKTKLKVEKKQKSEKKNLKNQQQYSKISGEGISS